jgi:hypothetical protein
MPHVVFINDYEVCIGERDKWRVNNQHDEPLPRRTERGTSRNLLRAALFARRLLQ